MDVCYYKSVNALRTPVYAEMVNIVNDKPVEFSKYKFDADTIRSMFDNFSFNNAQLQRNNDSLVGISE